MDFGRVLNQKFITELNRLHGDEHSWWHKMVEDDDVFILIRKNRVHVLVNGGLLLQVSQNRGGLICKAHEDFLSLRNVDDPYVTLTERETASIKRVKGLKGLSEHYEKVKRRIKLFTGREKQVVQGLGLGIEQIIDLEVGLGGEKKEGASRKGAQRIDMAGISDNGALVFFEVKLFDNSEIRARGEPKVVGQLKKYRELLKRYRSEILDGYEKQFEVYEKLEGSFFKRRMPKPEKFYLYPRTRLIITEFDGSQRDFLHSTILKGILKGMKWEADSPDLIAVGKHKIIKEKRLFRGL